MQVERLIDNPAQDPRVTWATKIFVESYNNEDFTGKDLLDIALESAAGGAEPNLAILKAAYRIANGVLVVVMVTEWLRLTSQAKITKELIGEIQQQVNDRYDELFVQYFDEEK